MKRAFCVLIAVAVLMSFAFAAFATEFTPSVSGKDAPQVVSDPEDGSVAQIYDNGLKIAIIPVGSMIVTPYADAGTTEYPVVAQRLTSSHEELAKTQYMSSLKNELNAAAKEYSENCTANDFVATDLFDIHLTGTYATELEDADYLAVTFDLELKEDDRTPVILLRDSDGEWNIGAEVETGSSFAKNTCQRNADDTVTVLMEKEGTIAFLTIPQSVIDDPDRPAPQTGLSNTTVIVIAVTIVLFAAIGIFAGVAYGKRRKA